MSLRDVDSVTKLNSHLTVSLDLRDFPSGDAKSEVGGQPVEVAFETTPRVHPAASQPCSEVSQNATHSFSRFLSFIRLISSNVGPCVRRRRRRPFFAVRQDLGSADRPSDRASDGRMKGSLAKRATDSRNARTEGGGPH